MIIIVTNKQDYTADFLILELIKREINFIRLNTEEFPQNINITIEINNNSVGGQLKLRNNVINLNEIKSVWYRRPVPSEPPEEVRDVTAKEFIVTESKETLEGMWRILDCFWVSHPDNLHRAESKIYQLKLATELGFLIPQTLITNFPNSAEKFYQSHEEAIIYKPQRYGRIVREETLSLIFTNVVGVEKAQEFASLQIAPGLFQPCIPKKFDIRVTVIGERVFAVEIHSQENVNASYDWRRVNAADLKHLPHQLPSEIERKCIELVKLLGLKFGAIDLILTPDNAYVFLEINPNGQWAWIQQLCPDIHLKEALADLLVQGVKDD